MDPFFWLILLMAAGAALFFAELFLPTHGLLGLLGVACVAGAIGTCFYMNRWLGIGALFAAIIATPFAFQGMVNLWQKTPLGRRIVLNTVVGQGGTPRPAVLVGMTGLTVSELRPMGECEFNTDRVQCQSETGNTIPSGTAVRLIAMKDTVAVVRATDALEQN